MFKSKLFTALFLVVGLLIHSSAAAIPPACVLACVNEQPAPSDIGSICGSEGVQSCLASKCGGSKQLAVEYFRSTCESAGHEVAQAVESSGDSSSSVNTAIAKATATTSSGVTTETASNSASGLTFDGILAVVLLNIGLFLVEVI